MNREAIVAIEVRAMESLFTNYEELCGEMGVEPVVTATQYHAERDLRFALLAHATSLIAGGLVAASRRRTEAKGKDGNGGFQLASPAKTGSKEPAK